MSWGAPLCPKAVDGTVGRLVGGRRGRRPDDFSVGGVVSTASTCTRT